MEETDISVWELCKEFHNFDKEIPNPVSCKQNEKKYTIKWNIASCIIDNDSISIYSDLAIMFSTDISQGMHFLERLRDKLGDNF